MIFDRDIFSSVLFEGYQKKCGGWNDTWERMCGRSVVRDGRTHTHTHTHTHSHTHWGAVEAEAEEDVVDERPRPKNACQIDK